MVKERNLEFAQIRLTQVSAERSGSLSPVREPIAAALVLPKSPISRKMRANIGESRAGGRWVNGGGCKKRVER